MGPGVGFFDYSSSGGHKPQVAPEPFLATATETDWSMLVDYGSRRSYRAGDPVIEIGDCTRALMIVMSGSLRVSEPVGRHGRQRIIGHIDRGSVVGELSFFDGSPRAKNVTAEAPTEVFVLEWDDFQRLAAVRPSLGILLLADLGRIIAARFRAAAGAPDV